MIFFAGIELNHVARSVESDLPINTVSVSLSVRPLSQIKLRRLSRPRFGVCIDVHF